MLNKKNEILISSASTWPQYFIIFMHVYLDMISTISSIFLYIHPLITFSLYSQTLKFLKNISLNIFFNLTKANHTEKKIVLVYFKKHDTKSLIRFK